MTRERLSTLDASFLAVERPTAHMHVGWQALLAPPQGRPRPTFEELREHVASRLGAAPRYRQRLAEVPLGAHHPVWVDDPDFDVRRHVHRAPPGDFEEVVADVMSEPLHRDRPLWELWFCDDLPDGRLGMIGKAHHCMVDGLAAVELATLLLDPSPDPPAPSGPPLAVAPPPSRPELLAGAVRDRLVEQARLALLPLRVASAPARGARALAETLAHSARALAHAAAPPAPPSALNGVSSPHRHLAHRARPLDDLRTIRSRFGTSVNDVLLAAVAGGLRDFLLERGEEPGPLKAMVPVSVRDERGSSLGNHISFVFVVLPCDEPDPALRLEDVAEQMAERKQGGEPEGADAALGAAALTPRFVQDAIAQLMASPRVFNLVVSNVPGPPVPLYLLGCRVDEVYPIVPLAQDHAVSVGMMTVAGRACFGLYADRRALPDADRLAGHVDAAVDELLALA